MRIDLGEEEKRCRMEGELDFRGACAKPSTRDPGACAAAAPASCLSTISTHARLLRMRMQRSTCLYVTAAAASSTVGITTDIQSVRS